MLGLFAYVGNSLQETVLLLLRYHSWQQLANQNKTIAILLN
jgi:hypothetical protein